MPFSTGRLFPSTSRWFQGVPKPATRTRTPVPTLWTSNAARETCHTVLRRMTFALELRKPPSQVRARIWGRELARHSIKATKKDAYSLAKEFDVTPGIASGAIAAASLCGGDLTAVRRGVHSLSRVIAGETPPTRQGDTRTIRSRPDPGRH